MVILGLGSWGSMVAGWGSITSTYRMLQGMSEIDMGLNGQPVEAIQIKKEFQHS